DLATVAKALKDYKAHHTLLVLNSCYSGAALDPDSGVNDAVGDLSGYPPFMVGQDTNLERAFRRPAFQIITATAADEPAGAEVEFAKTFANLAKALPGFQRRSPFTAVLLQGLQGLAGLPNGRLLGSELGLYMNTALVSEQRLRLGQLPQYGRLGRGG